MPKPVSCSAQSRHKLQSWKLNSLWSSITGRKSTWFVYYVIHNWCRWNNFFLLPSLRFHEHWRFVLQRLVFLSAFVVYLEGENLVTREEVAQILGSRYHPVHGVHPATITLNFSKDSFALCSWGGSRERISPGCGGLPGWRANYGKRTGELALKQRPNCTFRFNPFRCLSTVAVSGEQRHGGGLQSPAANLQLHQRTGLGLPPPQPEERPPAEALRRPQVRREEDWGGGLRPLHPRPGQGARVGQVGGSAADWPQPLRLHWICPRPWQLRTHCEWLHGECWCEGFKKRPRKVWFIGLTFKVKGSTVLLFNGIFMFICVLLLFLFNRGFSWRDAICFFILDDIRLMLDAPFVPWGAAMELLFCFLPPA